VVSGWASEASSYCKDQNLPRQLLGLLVATGLVVSVKLLPQLLKVLGCGRREKHAPRNDAANGDSRANTAPNV